MRRQHTTIVGAFACSEVSQCGDADASPRAPGSLAARRLPSHGGVLQEETVADVDLPTTEEARVHLESGAIGRTGLVARTTFDERALARLHRPYGTDDSCTVDERDVEWNARTEHPESRGFGLYGRVEEEHAGAVGKHTSLHEAKCLLSGRLGQFNGQLSRVGGCRDANLGRVERKNARVFIARLRVGATARRSEEQSEE